jgi:hypothetical protein
LALTSMRILCWRAVSADSWAGPGLLAAVRSSPRFSRVLSVMEVECVVACVDPGETLRILAAPRLSTCLKNMRQGPTLT